MFTSAYFLLGDKPKQGGGNEKGKKADDKLIKSKLGEAVIPFKR